MSDPTDPERPRIGVGSEATPPLEAGPGHWRRGDVFRAALFGTLAVVYAVLLLPLTFLVLLLWAAVALFGGTGRREAA